MKAKLLDSSWHYTSAADTAKPGYLKRRFDAIRRKQKEQEEKNAAEAKEKVRALKVR